MKRRVDYIFNRIIPTMKKSSKEKRCNDTKMFKFKLIASFLVPIMFILFLGIVSILKASDVIESKYEKAAEDTLNMASECMKFGFNSVEATAKLYADDSLIQRYSISQDDKIKAFVYADSLGNILCSKKAVDEFIKNIYLVNKNVHSISTGVGIDSAFYHSFKKTNLGQILDSGKTENIWDGEDEFLDKQLETRTDDYAMRLIRNVSNFDAFLIFDVKADVVKNILSAMKFDKSSFLGLVTPDGKEIIDYSLMLEKPSIDMEAVKSEKIFVNQAFYKDIMDGEEVSGSKYIDYKGASYFFLYSKVNDTGATLCALIPKSTITDQADGIKNVIILIVILACIIAILLTAMLVSGIDKIIKNIISGKLPQTEI